MNTKLDFLEKLLYGQEAEIAVSKWLMRKGYYVVPRYIPNSDDEDAPSMFGVSASYVLPDLDVFNGKQRFWFEVKRKKAYAWGGVLQTGFSPRNLDHYKTVQKQSCNSVFVGFYDEKLVLLYGNWLDVLCQQKEQNGQKFPRYWDGKVKGKKIDRPIMFFPINAMVMLVGLEELKKQVG